jgi:ABC-2 type transport system permease protein
MNRTLLLRSFRDNGVLLVSCCVLSLAFVWLRVWVASKIRMETFVRIFAEGLNVFSKLLPVPIEDLASPLGRAAFSFEEGPVILLIGLWAVTRGSECLAGRLGSGTMEMLLAQPLRRITLVTSHTAVTLVGVLLLGVACWAGLAAGLATSEFDPPPSLRSMIPGVINYLGLGAFLVGASTFASAISRTRAQAVAAVMGFYVVELALDDPRPTLAERGMAGESHHSVCVRAHEADAGPRPGSCCALADVLAAQRRVVRLGSALVARGRNDFLSARRAGTVVGGALRDVHDAHLVEAA